MPAEFLPVPVGNGDGQHIPVEVAAFLQNHQLALSRHQQDARALIIPRPAILAFMQALRPFGHVGQIAHIGDIPAGPAGRGNAEQAAELGLDRFLRRVGEKVGFGNQRRAVMVSGGRRREVGVAQPLVSRRLPVGFAAVGVGQIHHVGGAVQPGHAVVHRIRPLLQQSAVIIGGRVIRPPGQGIGDFPLVQHPEQAVMLPVSQHGIVGVCGAGRHRLIQYGDVQRMGGKQIPAPEEGRSQQGHNAEDDQREDMRAFQARFAFRTFHTILPFPGDTIRAGIPKRKKPGRAASSRLPFDGEQPIPAAVEGLHHPGIEVLISL